MVLPVCDTRSVWSATARLPRHPSLAFNLRVDVAVVGGGLTGATTAYLLKQAGCSVALIEKERCGQGETARITAQVSAIPRRGLADLVDRLGPTRARLVWDAGFAAVARLRSLVRDERINCDFAWVPHVFHTASATQSTVDVRALDREAEAAATLDVDVDYRETWPGIEGPAVVFDGQARLHPLRYLSVLVNRIPDARSHVFEDTAIDVIDGDGPFELRSGGCRITAEHVVLATHEPVLALAGADQRRLPCRLQVRAASFVSGVAGPGALGEGLYWSYTDGPQIGLRMDRHADRNEVCAGLYDCDDVPTSGPDGAGILASAIAALAPSVRMTHRWRGHLVESSDGLPLVGEIAPRRFVTTGHGAEGLTFGTAGAMAIADAICGRANPWQDLFGFTRGRSRGLRLVSRGRGRAAERQREVVSPDRRFTAPILLA